MDDGAREFQTGGTDISGEVGFPLHLQVLSKEDIFRQIIEPRKRAANHRGTHG